MKRFWSVLLAIALICTLFPIASAAEHDFVESWSYDDTYHWHACSQCDAVSDKDYHVRNHGVVTREPTVSETGVKTYACWICDYPMHTEELSWLDHDHDFDANGVCTVCGAWQPARLTGEVYEIANAGNLAWFGDRVNAGYYRDSAKLIADIDLSCLCHAETGEGTGNAVNWVPIGKNLPFAGIFDGQGHTVSGLYINAPKGSCLGLFSQIGEADLGTVPLSTAAVRNLTVSGSVSGESFVGGICGLNGNGTIENCISAVTVRGTRLFVGGIVGDNDSGVVKYCVNTGSVTGEGTCESVGGIVGNNVYGTIVIGTIESCINVGTVTGSDECVGGICGSTLATFVRNCYNIGAVSGPENYTGAITGCFWVPSAHADHAELVNCFYLSGTADVGIGADPAYAELNGDGEATEMTAGQFASGQVAYLLRQGDAIWGQTIGDDDYPVLNGAPVYYEYTGTDCTEKGYTNTPGGQPGEHSWDQGVETAPAGCEDAGVMTYTCTVCDQPRTEEIEALGHDWQDATCTEPKTCSRCHTTEGEALGHDWGEWAIIQPATAATEGCKERICARCSETEAQGIPPLGFDFFVVAWQFRDATGAACDAPVDGGTLAAITIDRTEGALEALVIVAVYSGDAITGAKVLSPVGEEDPVGLPMNSGDTAKVFILQPRTLVPFEVSGLTAWPWSQ